MHVLGEMEINAHVLEGTFRHDQAHTAGKEKNGEVLVHRRIYVWSDELQISGFADTVEEDLPPDPSPFKRGELIPIEYNITLVFTDSCAWQQSTGVASPLRRQR